MKPRQKRAAIISGGMVSLALATTAALRISLE